MPGSKPNSQEKPKVAGNVPEMPDNTLCSDVDFRLCFGLIPMRDVRFFYKILVVINYSIFIKHNM